MTHSGLAHLRGLTRLHNLNLRECKQVTNAGVVELQRALPDCSINHS